MWALVVLREIFTTVLCRRVGEGKSDFSFRARGQAITLFPEQAHSDESGKSRLSLLYVIYIGGGRPFS